MKRLLPFLLFPVVALAAEPISIPPFEPKVERADPALDQILAPGANLEKVAEGFHWS